MRGHSFQFLFVRCLFSAFLFLLSLNSYSQVTIGEPQAQYLSIGHSIYPSNYMRNSVPLEQEFSFEDLIQLIQNKNIKTIEDLVPTLPQYMRDGNYIFVYSSRSLQVATPSEPRIILYTPSARMIVTFNSGNKKLLGHNTLEVIQFRPSTSRFEFREITFDGIQNPKVSDPNPQKCLACHQGSNRKNVDPRPNWEPYSFWPGVIGSDAGFVSDRPVRFDSARHTDEDRPYLEATQFEIPYAKNFADNISRLNGRYSALLRLNYSAPKDLTDHINTLNAFRVVRLILDNSFLVEKVPQAPYVLSVCGVQANHPLMKELRTKFKDRYFDYSNFGSYYSPEHALRVSQAFTEFFEAFGIDTSDWSTDFATRGRFAFYERFGSPSSEYPKYLFVLRNLFPQFEENCPKAMDSFFTDLEKLVRSDEGQNLLNSTSGKIPPSGAEILARCTKCHESYDPKIPQINLLDSKYLKDIRKRTHVLAPKEIQMPPIQRLPHEEREILLNYLQQNSLH